MTPHRHQHVRTLLRSVVAATLIAALVTAGTVSFAQASSPVRSAAEAPTVSATSTGPSLTELLPTPAFPVIDMPAVPVPTAEPETSDAPSDHCDDRSYSESRTYGDPSDYVAACGTWPSWLDRGDDMPCLPGERNCTATASDGPGAAPYTGPTVGRPWSPEYGYYEGRTDGPKNSQGEPYMQGRDNDDPNCRSHGEPERIRPSSMRDQARVTALRPNTTTPTVSTTGQRSTVSRQERHDRPGALLIEQTRTLAPHRAW